MRKSVVTTVNGPLSTVFRKQEYKLDMNNNKITTQNLQNRDLNVESILCEVLPRKHLTYLFYLQHGYTTNEGLNEYFLGS